MIRKGPKQSPAQPLPSPDNGDSMQCDVSVGIEHLTRCRHIGEKLRQYSSINDAGRRKRVQLAAEEGIPESDVCRYVQFFREYTEPELEALFAEFRANNFVFSLTHFRAVMAVKEKGVRATLTAIGIQQRLSTDALRLLVKENLGGHKSRGGRKPAFLRLDDAGIEGVINREKEKLCRHVDQALTRHREIGPDLRQRLQLLRQSLK